MLKKDVKEQIELIQKLTEGSDAAEAFASTVTFFIIKSLMEVWN